MKINKQQRFYKIGTYGHIKPTFAGWFILVCWTYFFSKVLFSALSPTNSFFDKVNLQTLIISIFGAFTLLIGSWLITTLLHYTFSIRKQFRKLATTFWLDKIRQGQIPNPPVKKVTYNYATWTTTVIYPDHTIYQAKFHINDKLYFIFPTSIVQTTF